MRIDLRAYSSRRSTWPKKLGIHALPPKSSAL
jgi:hypothetical protein